MHIRSEPEVTGQKPGFRNNHATTTLGKNIFLHGGHNGNVWLDDLFILDTLNMIWNKISFTNTDIPSARACHTLSKINRQLYMFGGYDGQKCYNDIEIFDTDNKTWSKPIVSGKVPLARNAHSITVVGKNLFLFGGHSGNKHLKDLHIFNTETKNWSEPIFSGTPPEGLRGHTATFLGNKLIIFGGYDGKGRSNQLYLLNLEDMSWSHVLDTEKFPGSRQRHSAITIDNRKILIFGGFDGTKWLNDLHILDVGILMENIIQKTSTEEFQNDMKNLLNQKEFSDICFQLKDESLFYGHKAIFAGRSEFFLEKFRELNILHNNNNNADINNINENTQTFNKDDLNNSDCVIITLKNNNYDKILELPEISFETFSDIAEYIYTGKIDKINNLNIIDVLIWSNFFRLKELKEYCENFLIYRINSDNVIEILITSYKFGFIDLKSYAINYILSNFQEVNSNASFFELEAYPQLMMEIMVLTMNKIEKD